jgi:hypothetical protein
MGFYISCWEMTTALSAIVVRARRSYAAVDYRAAADWLMQQVQEGVPVKAGAQTLGGNA